MKVLSMSVLALVLSVVGAQADPIEGTWQTEVDDGSYAHIAITPCGSAYCGHIAETFNSSGSYQSPNLGRQLVIDMEPQGDGEYHGSVWRPSNDKIYIGRMNLDGDSARLRGCILGGLVCSSQTWSRVSL
ncbi:DUF2147 domain-containing protein [Cochlodiniinecator piscidefendens]|uniref:DUF2147 domain-containing protein n=1 Tax=Cochlodiniinecator piscidefendens TaxID=2715756 RepID=UPI00140B55C3|nr:DUF2147 domain-containing protein [Cochlodiniinecator piscidefendens]